MRGRKTARPIYPDVRDELNLMYDGTCDVYVTQTVADANGVERESESLLFKDIACNKTSESVTQTTDGIVSEVAQKITLILDRQYQIPPGSRIVVTQWDETQEFENSGEPDYYLSHQEIPIKLIESKA